MQQIMNAGDVEQALTRMAEEIKQRNNGTASLVVVGIHTRGYHLGVRLAERLGVPYGSLDIALYRDDLDLRGVQPVLKGTDIPFAVEDHNVILVDDVLFTGRTIRSALDALADLGRSQSIQLAVLVDRGHRELPVQADYAGLRAETPRDQRVTVKLNELDGEDAVVVHDTGSNA